MAIFHSLVDRFSANPSDESMAGIVNYFEREDSSDEDIAYLAGKLAGSGESLDVIGEGITADVASTGGPSSLSTLLCPLYLRALGFIVPALAVPGRPAGGVDVLAQIPGYRVDLTPQEAAHVLRKCGYAHFTASRLFAPLDSELFYYRRRHEKENIPELVIASLLSKKIAAGTSLIGLDVRVAPHGNFGKSAVEASQNADRFCRIAALLNRKAVCFLSDATIPYQSFIGRGEALVAMLAILNGPDINTLRKHNDVCYAMSNRLAFCWLGYSPLRPTTFTIRTVLTENLESQGSSMDALIEHACGIEAAHYLDILADEDGFFCVDLKAIRGALVERQLHTATKDTPFSDPCGVILRSDHGHYIRKGDRLATFRCPKDHAVDFRKALIAALKVQPEPAANFGFLEVRCG